MWVQQIIERNSTEELDAHAVGYRADHRRAIVSGVDVNAEGTRSPRHVDDINDSCRA
jgi:hypothetical protein